HPQDHAHHKKKPTVAHRPRRRVREPACSFGRKLEASSPLGACFVTLWARLPTFASIQSKKTNARGYGAKEDQHVCRRQSKREFHGISHVLLPEEFPNKAPLEFSARAFSSTNGLTCAWLGSPA